MSGRGLVSTNRYDWTGESYPVWRSGPTVAEQSTEMLGEESPVWLRSAWWGTRVPRATPAGRFNSKASRPRVPRHKTANHFTLIETLHSEKTTSSRSELRGEVTLVHSPQPCALELPHATFTLRSCRGTGGFARPWRHLVPPVLPPGRLVLSIESAPTGQLNYCTTKRAVQESGSRVYGAAAGAHGATVFPGESEAWVASWNRCKTRLWTADPSGRHRTWTIIKMLKVCKPPTSSPATLQGFIDQLQWVNYYFLKCWACWICLFFKKKKRLIFHSSTSLPPGDSTALQSPTKCHTVDFTQSKAKKQKR